MSDNIYFATGKNHVLCKIPGLDPIEFPYPNTFQDCWDNNHVRLPCSEKPSHASSSTASSSSHSRWTEIVQGLTTPITDSDQLFKVMTRWNGGDRCSWNINALKIFLDRKANRARVATQSHARRRGRTSPETGAGQERDCSEEEELSSSSSSSDLGIEAILGESTLQDARDDNGRDEEEDEVDFFNAAERDRFFRTVLPRIQELALRLPELVKKPIPLLKRQDDSAVTLSQEQIGCLLANAFFNTFPNRGTLSRRFGADEPAESKKRQYQDSEFVEKDNKRKAGRDNERHGQNDTAKRSTGSGSGSGTKTGTESKTASSSLKPNSAKDPFRNADGQLSLFAYFGKSDPKSPATSALSRGENPRVVIPISETGKSRNRTTTASTSRSGGSGGDDDGYGEKRAKSTQGRPQQHEDREKHERQRQVEEEFSQYPSINFWSLFESDRKPSQAVCIAQNAAKLRCIIHYFDRITTNKRPINLDNRQRINNGHLPCVTVSIDRESPLEDEAPPGALQLDFANKIIGGGVLGNGAVQEEIRFVICPELIVSRLFTQNLQDNEALLIKGAERFSNYNGYGASFTWHSDFVDHTPRDNLGRRMTEICAIDALPFWTKQQRLRQFSRRSVLRELNKAVVGFRRSPITSSSWGLCRAEAQTSVVSAIATGNWGCGAFGGHLQLKFLIQLMAASVCHGYSADDRDDSLPLGREIVYYTYGLDDFADQVESFMSNLHACQRRFDPSLIMDCIMQYPIQSTKGEILSLPQKSLLDYVGRALGFPANPDASLSTTESFSSSSVSYSELSLVEADTQ
ncbi:hypothetical protein BGZ99_001820 [Dissophora globulifera]|uniref:poly(ADP-ribose) glycohydrolase n=1 Tax=Dissophora globulifera TaxID=979702 RepID=A0A9P6RQA4_9FUNG|nr:hypothetical protein BGZ99_001820 [Dissophora globulifera]